MCIWNQCSDLKNKFIMYNITMKRLLSSVQRYKLDIYVYELEYQYNHHYIDTTNNLKSNTNICVET